MREVRMTFGEHLEELRRRIILCIVYLVAAVSITMTYGQSLLEWTLGPHYEAVSAARRDRVIRRVKKTVNRLGQLMSAEPPETSAEEPPLIDGPVLAEDWALVFAKENVAKEARAEIAQPFAAYAALLRSALATLPAEARESLAAGFQTLGEEVSARIASEFSVGVGAPEFWDLPNRFLRVKGTLQDALGSTAGGAVESTMGWAEDYSDTLEAMDRFLKFLDARRAQALEAPTPLAALRARTLESKLPPALHEVCVDLESDARQLIKGETRSIMVTSYLESVMAYLKVALIFGIFISLPFILYEIWKFVGAGLYPHEQRYVVTLLPFSLLLFFGGALFGYAVMIPVGLQFLARWGIEEADLNFTLDNYIGLFFTLTLILGLVFQTPLVMIFLAKIRIMNVERFRKGRRVAVFVGVCLSVVFTPPDPFSWAVMAIPMILLYEVGIFACAFLARRPSTEPASGERGREPPTP